MRKYHKQKYKIKYSQNFLKRSFTIKRLIDLMDIRSDDLVVEVGAGSGQLTKELLLRADLVIGIEKDTLLANKLALNHLDYSNLVVLNTDFLTQALPNGKFKVVGNIPFAEAAEIIKKLTEGKSIPTRSYLIMQLEAARHIVGEPIESLKSLRLKPVFETKLLTVISKEEFVPMPKVDAGLVMLAKREIPELGDLEYQKYLKFLDNMFTGYFPTVFRRLKSDSGYHRATKLSKDLKIDLDRKRGEVTYKEWLSIFKYLGSPQQ